MKDAKFQPVHAHRLARMLRFYFWFCPGSSPALSLPRHRPKIAQLFICPGSIGLGASIRPRLGLSAECGWPSADAPGNSEPPLKQKTPGQLSKNGLPFRRHREPAHSDSALSQAIRPTSVDLVYAIPPNSGFRKTFCAGLQEPLPSIPATNRRCWRSDGALLEEDAGGLRRYGNLEAAHLAAAILRETEIRNSHRKLSTVFEERPLNPKCTSIDLQVETPGAIEAVFATAVFCMELMQ